MSAALVGAAGAIATTATTSVTPAFGQATTSGHLLVARVAAVGTALGQISTTSSGWTLAVSGPTGSTMQSAIFYKVNSAAGETAPTFTCTGATAMFADLEEVSGSATSSPVDQSAVGLSGNATNPANDANPGEFVTSAWIQTGTKSATDTITITWTNPTGGTVVAAQNTGATKALQWFAGSSYITSVNTSVDNANFSGAVSTGASNGAVGVVASFKLPGSPAPNDPVVVNVAVSRASNW